MIGRAKRRQDAEAVALAALRKQRKPWVSAHDLAKAAGHPWRTMARALLRMVAAGRVEEHVIEWRDDRFRPRETRLYRAGLASTFKVAAWPETLMPRVRKALHTDAHRAQVQRKRAPQCEECTLVGHLRSACPLRINQSCVVTGPASPP